MKTSMLIILTCLSVVGITAQQHDYFAMADTDEVNLKLKKRTIRNSAYVSSFSNLEFSSQIQSFQRYVANYNVKESEIFNVDDPSYYHLDFKNGNCKISVNYDKQGNILSSSEKYIDIKLPYEISSTIIKENPGWEINKTQCAIAYFRGKPAEVRYKIVITKGNQEKIIKM